MIKKFVNGYEHFECSRCGEETEYDADYCETCGHQFRKTQTESELEDTASDDETMCIVVSAQKLGFYTFTQLKIDKTPRSLLNLLSFQNQRMMAEANPYEIYVFSNQYYPFLSQGVQVNLALDGYDKLQNENGFTIFYNRVQFSDDAIEDLKTFKFKV